MWSVHPLDAEGVITTSGPFMWGLPQVPSHICNSCAQQIANVVIGMRSMQMKNVTPDVLVDYRRSRLAELLPKNLFSDERRRKSYHMKEVLMLQPKGPRLLVKRIDAPKPTSSTIVIPETIDGEQSCYALVLAIGKLSEDIKVADTIILQQYSGSPVQVELDGEMLEAQIVMESDVLAVVEE